MADRLERAIRQRTEKVSEELMVGPGEDDDI
jgi:recombination protein RecA